MNINVIEDYIRKLTKGDIVRFAIKQNILLSKKEIDFIYEYIKKEYKKIIFSNPQDIFKDVKGKIQDTTYNKMVSLYEKYADKLALLAKTIRENS